MISKPLKFFVICSCCIFFNVTSLYKESGGPSGCAQLQREVSIYLIYLTFWILCIYLFIVFTFFSYLYSDLEPQAKWLYLLHFVSENN